MRYASLALCSSVLTCQGWSISRLSALYTGLHPYGSHSHSAQQRPGSTQCDAHCTGRHQDHRLWTERRGLPRIFHSPNSRHQTPELTQTYQEVGAFPWGWVSPLDHSGLTSPKLVGIRVAA